MRGLKDRSDRVLIGLMVILAGATSAMGQNALGDGRGLEKQLQRTSNWQGNVPRADFRSEVRMRNAVVTGNVGEGKSFRGNISYTDPDDFRGSLGSDSLFRFRRDSFGAGNTGNVGFRGTESLQYQYNFSTGLSRDTGVFSRGLSNEPTSTPSSLVNAPIAKRPAYDSSGSDSAAPNLGTLRSTAAFTANRGLSPALVGFINVRDGVLRVTASGLLGLRTDLLVPDVASGKLVERNPLSASPGQPALGPESSASPAQPATSAYESLRAQLDAKGGFDRAQASKPEAKPPAKPDATKPDSTKPDATKSDTTKPQTPAPEAPGTDPNREVDPETGLAYPRGLAAWEKKMFDLRVQMTTGKPRQPVKPGVKPRSLAGLDDETMAIIRSNNAEVSAYLAGLAPPGDPYAEHMSAGQAMLADGRYFDAEERFARALAVKSGDPTAMAGRVNAQLGAGLYLSAAINLRQLFEQHPEVIAVRYTGPALPKADRLTKLKEDLTKLAGVHPGDTLKPESGLLLAYVGYQTNDAAAVRDGLGVLRRAYEGSVVAAAKAAGVDPAPDLVLDMLEGAWAHPAGPGAGSP